MQSAVDILAVRPQPTPNDTARRRVTVIDADLSPFSDVARLASGQVTLVSLEAVADQLGGSWQKRRSEVYDRASRTLSKRLSAGGAFARVSETDYLIVQPGSSAAMAEGAALRFLTEIIGLFLAEVTDADLRLFRVAAVSDNEIAASARDANKVRLAAEQPAPDHDIFGRGPALVSSNRWEPFITGGGRKVRPSCVLEPVFELNGNNRIGYRLRRRVVDVATGQDLSPVEQGALSRGDILRIDMATIARGIARLHSTVDGDRELSLIIPVSFFSLTHAEGGAMLAKAFSEARQAVRAGVICEICDIEDVPEHLLSYAIGLIRPYSLFVIGRLADDKPRASPAMKAAGVQVTAITCPDHLDGDAQFLGWLRAGMRASRRIGRSTMVYGCKSPRRLALAGAMGATHASITAQDASLLL